MAVQGRQAGREGTFQSGKPHSRAWILSAREQSKRLRQRLSLSAPPAQPFACVTTRKDPSPSLIGRTMPVGRTTRRPRPSLCCSHQRARGRARKQSLLSATFVVIVLSVWWYRSPVGATLPPSLPLGSGFPFMAEE